MSRSERQREEIFTSASSFTRHSVNQRSLKKTVDLEGRGEPGKKLLRSQTRHIRISEEAEARRTKRIRERVVHSLDGAFERVDPLVLMTEIRYLTRRGISLKDILPKRS